MNIFTKFSERVKISYNDPDPIANIEDKLNIGNFDLSNQRMHHAVDKHFEIGYTSETLGVNLLVFDDVVNGGFFVVEPYFLVDKETNCGELHYTAKIQKSEHR